MSALPEHVPSLDDWLAILCRGIGGAEHALVSLRLGPDGEARRPAAWPAGASPPEHLRDAAQNAVTRRVPLVSAVVGDDGERFDVGYPLMRNDQVSGVVAVTVRGAPGDQQSAVQALRRGADWLELMLRTGLQQTARPADGSAPETLDSHLLEVATAALSQGDARAGALAAVSMLATHLDCERVSWGRAQGSQATVLAISDTAEVDQRRPLVRLIAGAMEEASDIGTPVIFPPEAGSGVASVHAHRVLAEAGRCPVVLTVPVGGPAGGVLVAECPTGTDAAATADALARAAGLLAPLLATREAAERGPLAASRWRVQGIISGAALRKVAIAAVVVGAIAGSVWVATATGPYTVRAEAVVEGRVQNALTAPFAGYLAAVHAVPGDAVRAGQTLAVLEARTLKLELDQLESERDALRKGHRRALAGLNKSESRIISARIAQVDAQLELAESRIDRTQVKAPYDGIVLSGDLSRSLGRPVSQGEVLLEVAPLDDFRVVVDVEGSDVAYVAPGQIGEVRLAALPDSSFGIEVKRLSSVAESGARAGAFRIEASLLNGSDKIRPGMRGIARLDAGERPLLESWFHQALTPIRLWWWTWAP